MIRVETVSSVPDETSNVILCCSSEWPTVPRDHVESNGHLDERERESIRDETDCVLSDRNSASQYKSRSDNRARLVRCHTAINLWRGKSIVDECIPTFEFVHHWRTCFRRA